MPGVGDVFRVVVRFNLNDITLATNTIAFSVVAGTCTDSELLAGCEQWVEDIYTEVDDCIRTDVSVEDSTVYEMTYNGSTSQWEVSRIVGVISPSLTFTEIAETIPYGVAGLITLPTSHPRTFGRLFLPGMSTDQQEDNNINATDLAKLALAAAEIIASWAPGTATAIYVLLSKGGVVRGALEALAKSLLAYQRRRKPGVGV
jgi:hypothetical protein